MKPAISVSENGIEFDSDVKFRTGCDILITTPNDLLRLMKLNSVMLADVQFLVHYDIVKRRTHQETIQKLFQQQWFQMRGTN